MDSPDTYVERAFETYLESSTVSVDGTLITKTQEAGPLSRFLDALSFSISDRLTEQGEIGVLYDIGKCPDEFLELLGELIGWKFIGGDVDKWRVQLRNAVFIYKMKGTRKAIQYLLDTLFSTGVFVVDTDDTINELWESYVPDLMYYALATSSPALKDLDTYTPELSRQFGVVNYSPTDLDTNIKYIVDKIIFDLVREFPNSFYLGNGKFPQVQLASSDTGEPYLGPYHLMPPLDPTPDVTGTMDYVDNPQYMWQWPRFMTGSTHEDDSVYLDLVYDPSFVFYYRERPYLIPPYEKRQYYTGTQVTESMLERIQYYLKCYGVDSAFAEQVVSFIRDNLSSTLEIFRVLNNFNLFTKEKKYPPNYDVIIKNATKERAIDPMSLLSLWNGKSSHFLMNFEASTFNWETQALTATSKYGLTKVKSVLDQVIPAHAIPTILLSVSDVANSVSALVDSDCREIRPNFNDLYEGSSTVTTNFATCAVNMLDVATDVGIPQHRFKRAQANNVNDALLSGVPSLSDDFTAVNRNALRRRNFHNLLQETKMFTRRGHNNPGSMQLSSPHYSSGVGFLPLGFMPSSLSFKEVALRSSDGSTVGLNQLLDKPNVHPVWEICQNLSSFDGFFGYAVSDTFASRAKQTGRGRFYPTATIKDGSACTSYGRRGQLQEIMYVMNKINDAEKHMQASSLVWGYLLEDGSINPSWETSSPLLDPIDFSSWYNARRMSSTESAEEVTADVIRGIGNYLINKHSGDASLNYYEHFTFGQKVHKLYNSYLSEFSGHGTNTNYNLMGVPNFFSHTFGPLIYNSKLEIDGSALAVSSYVAASSPSYEVNIAYLGGSGVLSISGMDLKTEQYSLGTSAASDSGDLPLGSGFTDSTTAPPCEFRNTNLVSSIELVDTSAPYLFEGHPIFSLFRLSRDDQSKYSYAKYLINNQVIKYHRGYDTDVLPRLRIKIDNSNSDKDGTPTKSVNFLEPEHTYEISVKAHNLDASSTLIGGLTLGCWIHTEPELDEVWTYVPQVSDKCGNIIEKWDRQLVADLSGPQGILLAKNKAQQQAFPVGDLNSLIGSGEGGHGPLTEDVYDYRCWEPEVYESLVLNSNPKAITNISEKTLTNLTFRFTTENTKAIIPSPTYRSAYGKVHRKDQKYTIEFFTMQGNSRQFIVFEDISIKDVTNYNNSVIQTTYGDARLDASNLKAVFRYFKDLSSGLASRNNVITSGVMEVSGGSRLNYRSNVDMYPHARDANTKQVELVYINEG